MPGTCLSIEICQNRGFYENHENHENRENRENREKRENHHLAVEIALFGRENNPVSRLDLEQQMAV